MIIGNDGRVRLTPSELNRLRRHAAKNGFVVETIGTLGEYLEASILGLTDDRVRDMLEFIDTLNNTSSNNNDA